MNDTFDLIVRGGCVVSTKGRDTTDVGIRNGRIAAIGDLGGATSAATFDAGGLHVLPGVIDGQVHFREPGGEHKEDLLTGTRAAVAGGVTAICEMPNTSPPTTTADALADKVARARGRASCDFAFFVGASPDNVDELPQLERLAGCVGVKIFMGSSTGSLLVADDPTVLRVLERLRRRPAVHSEDEDRLRERRALLEPGCSVQMHPVWRDAECALRSTRRLLALARRANRTVHVLHTTTAEEIEFLGENRDLATVECTPQHLTLVAPDCYDRLGTYAQMNPPIRDEHHRAALWRGVAAGTVDVIGSDHAPHTREEKDRGYPDTPSGMPGVQTLVPVMLDHVAKGNLSLERFVALTSAGPARVWKMPRKGAITIGHDADLTVVDLGREVTIDDAWIESRCGWTPFHGTRVKGWPVATVVRGRIVMRDGEIVAPGHGEPISFA